MENLSSFVLIITAHTKLATATDHIVGGPNGGWDMSSHLQTWPSSEQFNIGDNLVFQYNPMHDVVEVTKADYDSCSANSPIHTYSGGTTTIPLASLGKRYFLCGTPGHCSQGMKLEVDTLALATTSPSPEMPLVPSPLADFSAPSPAAESPENFPETQLNGPTLSRSSTEPSTNELAKASQTQPAASSAHVHLQASLAVGFSVLTTILAF